MVGQIGPTREPRTAWSALRSTGSARRGRSDRRSLDAVPVVADLDGVARRRPASMSTRSSSPAGPPASRLRPAARLAARGHRRRARPRVAPHRRRRPAHPLPPGRGAPAHPRARSRSSRAASTLLKRALDIAVSALALILLSPLFARCSRSRIKLDSPGPSSSARSASAATARRSGCCKFRSMAVDAEQQLAALMRSERGRRPAVQDARTTRASPASVASCASYSLDELPQLWNVLDRRHEPRRPAPAAAARGRRLRRARPPPPVHQARPHRPVAGQRTQRPLAGTRASASTSTTSRTGRSPDDLMIMWRTVKVHGQTQRGLLMDDRRAADSRIAMIGTRGVPAAYGGFETAVEEIGRRLGRARPRRHRVLPRGTARQPRRRATWA